MKKSAIARTIHEIDAAGRPVGRIATEIATILRGKNKPTFMPNVDRGDAVAVVHVDKMVLTGRKMKEKTFYRFSGYPGGLKTIKTGEVWNTKGPAAVLRRAVWYMLPKNKLQKGMIKRLTFKNI